MEQPPPSALDAERHILAVSIAQGLPLPDGLIPSDFFEPTNQDIASAITALIDEGTTPDELTVSQRLRQIGSPVEAFAVSDLSTTGQFIQPNPAWSRAVIKALNLRKLAENSRAVLKVVNEPGADPDAILLAQEQLAKSLARRKGQGKETSSTEYFDLDSMLSFDPADDKTVLIGAERRWICQGYPFQIVGFSGTGKSSLAVHLAVHWALGKSPFGLKPVRPLRILMVQAENDFGDAAEGLKGATAKLVEPERRALKDNLIFVRQSSKMGFEFVQYLGEMVEKHGIDLIIADPLLAYANFDIAKQDETSAFLRGPGGVFEMLQRTKAALLYMHHTTKPKSAEDLDSMTPQQLAYLGAGCAEWVNFARDSGYLFRTKANTSDGRPVYRFGFSKRQSRSGLKDANDRFAGHVNLCHAEDGTIRWEYAPPAMQDAQPTQKAHSSPAKGSPSRLDY
jgi:RecA/RadA recombinase